MTIFNDAQSALGFVQSQTAHIETQVNETVYPDIQYPSLIPVDTSAHEWAQTVTYYSSDKFGAADWINANAGDVPKVGTEMTEHSSAVFDAGIGYDFGLAEINQASMLGVNLQADKAMAARRAYEEMVDRVALTGDTTKNLQGLINNSGVTAASAGNGAWDGGATTEDEILADVNAVILGIAEDTAYTGMADTLLLPFAKLNTLATTRLGDTRSTILQFLRQNNTYTAMTGQELTIRGVRGLETAGSGSTNRMVAYRRAPDVLKLHIPMAHRFLPAFQKSPTYVEVAGMFRLGGLDIRRPKEVRYSDGI